jgi:hypothetical protein
MTARHKLDIQAPVNGRVGKSTVSVVDAEGRTVATDRADLSDAREQRKLADRLADKLGLDPDDMAVKLDRRWCLTLDEIRAQKAEDEQREKERAAEAATGPESVDERAERLLAEMPWAASSTPRSRATPPAASEGFSRRRSTSSGYTAKRFFSTTTNALTWNRPSAR